MITCFDIGNTHILIGVFQNNQSVKFWRLQSIMNKTEDEFFVSIKFLFDENNLKISDISGVVISSVVPKLTEVFTCIIQKYFKLRYIIVSSDLDLGLTYKTENPSEIGADLITNAFSAYKKYGELDKKNCIVIDCGTATTLQLITNYGEFLGAAICPGIQTSSENLFKRAALLSQINFESAEGIIGIDTKSALISGVILGSAIMIDGFIERIKKDYDYLEGKFFTVATGGLCEFVYKHTKYIDLVNKNLTLEGLNLIYNHLKKEQAYIN